MYKMTSTYCTQFILYHFEKGIKIMDQKYSFSPSHFYCKLLWVFLCQVVKEVTELKKQLQQYSISNRKKKAFGTSNKLEPLELHN